MHIKCNALFFCKRGLIVWLHFCCFNAYCHTSRLSEPSFNSIRILCCYVYKKSLCSYLYQSPLNFISLIRYVCESKSLTKHTKPVLFLRFNPKAYFISTQIPTKTFLKSCAHISFKNWVCGFYSVKSLRELRWGGYGMRIFWS